MKIFKCTMENLDNVTEFYDKVTEYLEKNINYPKWTHKEYPSRESVVQAIGDGSQYACEDNGRIIGAFVLNDDPQGDYSAGDWKEQLDRGEFLVIHALARDPEVCQSGLGRKMVEYCINAAKDGGYRAIRLDAVPTNIPARRLYEGMGFSFAGERDLSRGIEDIPEFVLYELNFI